jgi:hypothetical protein
MRQYIRAAATAPRSVDAHVLEAYCAWVLREEVRARAALEQAEQLLEEGDLGLREQAEWRTLIAALRYAL